MGLLLLGRFCHGINRALNKSNTADRCAPADFFVRFFKMSLSLRYLNDVNPYLKSELLYFGKWLRKHYDFPIPFEIRLINKKALVDFDGAKCAIRWWQNSSGAEAFKGEIAVGSFDENLSSEGPTVAFPTVIAAIGRVVQYYYQAIWDLPTNEDLATEWGDQVMNSFIDETTPPTAR